jgi:hypothetical protein
VSAPAGSVIVKTFGISLKQRDVASAASVPGVCD